MANFPTKRIIVFHNDIIPELGNIYGPIMTPFWCETSKIYQMVVSPKRVYEILPDGSRVLLNRHNYNQDNGGGTPPDPEPPITPNDNIPGEHLKEKIESNVGIHKSLRWQNGRFEKYNKLTDIWEVAYSEDLYSDVNTSKVDIGGIRKGMRLNGKTMDDIIFRMINPIVPPALTLTTTPSDEFYEKGTSISTIDLDLNVIKGEFDIAAVKFVKDGTVIDTPAVLPGTDEHYYLTYTTPVDTDTVFQGLVDDGEGDVVVAHTFQFILPKFFGIVSDTVVVDETIFALLDKSLNLNVNNPFTFTASNEKVCFAIPASASLVSVMDQNNFDITSLFSETTITYTLPDLTTESYKVYVTDDPMTVIDFLVTFNLTE
jgi:hypothetical protein